VKNTKIGKKKKHTKKYQKMRRKPKTKLKKQKNLLEKFPSFVVFL
jgi:hypothetical protein